MTSIMLLAFLIGSCCGVEFSSRPRNFSLELMYFTHLDHFVMSPFCVWSALTEAYLGGHGESYKQIQRAAVLFNNRTKLYENINNLTNTLFRFQSKGVEIDYKSYLLYHEGIRVREFYKAVLEIKFSVQVKDFNFKNNEETATLANTMVQDRFPTITNLFHADDFEETSVIIGDVIHFKGLLTTPFNATHTTEEIVYNENNKAVGSVSMMHLKGKLRYSNFESMNSNILELPYGDDGKFCMLVIFPYPGINTEDVYKKFEKISLRDIFVKLEKDLKDKERQVDVKMPRFRLRTSFTLNKPLLDMGLFDAFEPDLGGFEGISKGGLFISTVEHKADIIFTEAETVAFATTPGYFDSQPTSFNIKAKQPFIFFLMEKPTASILFGGIYSTHHYLNELNSHIIFNDK